MSNEDGHGKCVGVKVCLLSRQWREVIVARNKNIEVKIYENTT